LDGDHLSIEDVISVAAGAGAVSLAPQSVEKMLRSRTVVERLAAADAPVYGVNTGVGLLADVRVPPADLEQLQRNVIRSHAAGVGDPLARDEVRAMILIRANVLAKGFSGIRPVVAERLCQMLEHGVTPVVPSQGSVGASGDLAPLAHMALVLMGEGEAELRGQRMPGREALRLAGIEPLSLASKEGISLVNGTQAMLALGCLELAAAEVLIDTAEVDCAMTLDALRGTPRAFDQRLHAIRPHPGQRTTCRACSTGAKSARLTSPAGASRTPIRCAALHRCMVRCATLLPRPGAYFRSSSTPPPTIRWSSTKKCYRGEIFTASRWRSNWIIWRSRSARFLASPSGASTGW